MDLDVVGVFAVDLFPCEILVGGRQDGWFGLGG